MGKMISVCILVVLQSSVFQALEFTILFSAMQDGEGVDLQKFPMEWGVVLILLRKS